MGETISVRSLALLSNRSHSAVANWCAQDKWTEQKDRYLIALRSETESKVIESTSDRLAGELVTMNEEHMKGFELFRKMAQQFATILAAEIQDLGNSDRQKKVVDKDFTLAVQRYSSINAQMAQMQRLAMGMKYMDLNIAMEEIIKAGYEISEREPED